MSRKSRGSGRSKEMSLMTDAMVSESVWVGPGSAGERLLCQVGSIPAEFGSELLVAEGEDGHGEECGVGRPIHRHRCHRDPGRHLDGGEEGVHAVERRLWGLRSPAAATWPP